MRQRALRRFRWHCAGQAKQGERVHIVAPTAQAREPECLLRDRAGLRAPLSCLSNPVATFPPGDADEVDQAVSPMPREDRPRRLPQAGRTSARPFISITSPALTARFAERAGRLCCTRGGAGAIVNAPLFWGVASYSYSSYPAGRDGNTCGLGGSTAPGRSPPSRSEAKAADTHRVSRWRPGPAEDSHSETHLTAAPA
jgi:hypothetical protein